MRTAPVIWISFCEALAAHALIPPVDAPVCYLPPREESNKKINQRNRRVNVDFVIFRLGRFFILTKI